MVLKYFYTYLSTTLNFVLSIQDQTLNQDETLVNVEPSAEDNIILHDTGSIETNTNNTTPKLEDPENVIIRIF